MAENKKILRLINPIPNDVKRPSGMAHIFNIIPLQLATVASVTPENWDIDIQDENVTAIEHNAKPDLVGISIKACTANRGIEIANEYKKFNIPVIFGGSHASLSPESIKPYANAVVRGGVENIWTNLLSDFESGNLKNIYDGRLYRAIPKYKMRWELFDKKKYKIFSIIARRGCSYKCSFCTIPEMYDGVQSRNIFDVIDDIQRMESKYFILWDENPTDNIVYAENFFKALTPLNKTWFAEATTKVTENTSLLNEMGKSGCKAIYLGIESFSQKSLNNVGKGFNKIGRYKDIVKKLGDCGIMAHAGLVLGLDGDDESTFDETLEGLYKCNFVSASIKILTPYPGTKLHHRFEKERRIFDYKLEHYDEKHVVFHPKRMTADQLYDGYKYVVSNFYSMSSIATRIKDNILMHGINPGSFSLVNFGWRKDYFSTLLDSRHVYKKVMNK
ncbi:MAG: B12-binding domain-containing radical SAM protein [Deltaproteobacteria bacterium]|nr:B12-binding domain-containing radical SAM protein [Deltaproteobacteria bacterium]